MKALIKVSTEKGLELHDIPIPTVMPGHVLVKITAAGICGSDRHIYEWDEGRHAFSNNVPFTLGHEGAGVVHEVGATVKDIKPGDHVAFESHIYDDCSFVRRHLENICPHKQILGIGSNGVFAEYALVPQHIIRILPKKIPLEVGAILEPATIGLRALEELSEFFSRIDRTYATVAVFGATGLMGGVAALAAAEYGFNTYAFGRNAEKLKLLEAINPDIKACPSDPESVRALFRGKQVHAIIETTGAPESLDCGRSIIENAGCWIQIGIFGQQSDAYRSLINDVVRREITLKGVVGRTKREWKKVIDLLVSGKLKLKPLITDRYPLEDFERAFQTKEGIKSIFTID